MQKPTIWKEETNSKEAGLNNLQTLNVVNHNDVLCGRSRLAFDHPGNEILREKIAHALDEYNTCDRKVKTLIIGEIAKSITSSGGRFLKFDEGRKQWYDGGFKVAKARVSSGFRDARAYQKTKPKPTKRNKNTERVVLETQNLILKESPLLDDSLLDKKPAALRTSSLRTENPAPPNHNQGSARTLSVAQTVAEPMPADSIDLHSFDASSVNGSDDGFTSILLAAVDLIDVDCSTEPSCLPRQQNLKTNTLTKEGENIQFR
mmetsp:Transcript_18444/g.27867  ORF Transcript_18444/g.27867 Transcript_18444/m.27867 type:complete len:261 (-) Transcript_18444:154-936(-)